MDRPRLLKLLDRAERYGFIRPSDRDSILAAHERSPNLEAGDLFMTVAKLSPQQYARTLEDPPSSHRKASPLRSLGKYTLSQLIGRGGTGAVYKAWDEALKRWVAIKILNPGGRAPERLSLERFWREARAIARLTHPNIIPIYEVGEDAGIYFLAIKFIEGKTAHDLIPSLEPHRAAEIVRDAARALHHAHRNDIIHRDMKPANILIEAEHVWVVDFGVAKDLFGDSAAALTRAGMTLGTPHFMSPEQAQGVAVDARSDVYALGATLYALVTRGGTPFDGDTLPVVMDRVVHAEPIHPRARRPDLDAGLSDMIVRCLEKNAASRYQTAAQLADDLDRWLAGKAPQHARRTSPGARRRSMSLVLAAGVAAGVLLATGAAVVIASRRPEGRAAVKTTPPPTPEPAPPKPSTERGEALLVDARNALAAGRFAQAAALAREARGILGEEPRTYLVEGTALRMRGQLARATEALNRAVELGPALAAATLQRGLAHLRRYEETVGLLTPFLQQHGPIDVGSTSDLHEDAAPWRNQALADLRRVRLDEHDAGDRAMLDGAMAFLQSDGRGAVTAFASAPEHPEAILWTARLEQLAGDHDSAVATLDRYLERFPEDAHAWVIRAVSRLATKSYNDAVASCRRATEIDSKCVHAHYVNGLAHHAQAHYKQREESVQWQPAYDAYTRAVESDPEFPLTYLTRSLLLTHDQQLEKALADLTAFIKMKPKASIGYNRRASVFIRQHDYEGAIKDYTTAVELNPSYYYGYTNRAGIFMEQSKWKEAEDDYSTAIRMQPDDVRSIVSRGQCRFKLSRYAEAVTDFERAIKLNPRLADQLRDLLDEAKRRAREN